MQIKDFIDDYSEAYKKRPTALVVKLGDDAAYLEGFADGTGGNERLMDIAKNMYDLSHMLMELMKHNK